MALYKFRIIIIIIIIIPSNAALPDTETLTSVDREPRVEKRGLTLSPWKGV